MMAPILAGLAKDYAGQLSVQFIDVWKNAEQGEPYGNCSGLSECVQPMLPRMISRDMRILPGESCAEVREMIGKKLADLDRRMIELRRLRRSLVKLKTACGRRSKAETCPALWAIEK